MARVFLPMLATFVLSACASTQTDSDGVAQTAQADANDSEETMICTREKVTGSRTKGKRICRRTGGTD